MPSPAHRVDFELRHLEIFCKVVETGSITKAAHIVHLAQASVSERLARLEELVGTRLLDRLGRKVEPTRAGDILYKAGRDLLEKKRQVCEQMEDFLGMSRGEVRMGGSTIPGEYLLPGVIRRFHQLHPGISVSVTIGDTRDVVERAVGGLLELGVVGARHEEKHLHYTPLWQDDLVLVVPSGHPWRDRESICVQDLEGQPFVLREEGSGTRGLLEQALQKKGKSLEFLTTVAQLGSSTAVKEAVKQGLGVSILSWRAVADAVRLGLLCRVHVKDLCLARRFYLITDKRRVLSPPARALWDFLVADAGNALCVPSSPEGGPAAF